MGHNKLMMNIENVSPHKFRKKQATIECDPLRMLLTSAEAILDAEAEKKVIIRLNESQKEHQRMSLVHLFYSCAYLHLHLHCKL